MSEEFRKEFIEQAIDRIEESAHKLETCINELDPGEVWKRPNENSNSIGNIVLHLCGNIRQYAISSLGNLPDVRERDKEFTATGGLDQEELKKKFLSTVREAKDIILNISDQEMLRKRQVQGYTHSGIGIILHVTEHLSYHTGQIIFWVKMLKNKDMGFYAGIDLNTKNEN